MNNVTYYSYFDTAVNHLLVNAGLLDIRGSSAIALVVESSCKYYRSVAFPDVLEIGLRVANLGRSSVRYEIGVFRQDDPLICASGHFIHVYVDRASGSPIAMDADTRTFLSAFANASRTRS